MSHAHADRRDHLRIHDSIFVDYRIVARDQVFGDAGEAPFAVSPRFRLLRDLYQVELDAAQLTRRIGEEQPRLGAYLQTVNRRLEVMASVLASEELVPGAVLAEDVTLSEGGLSFRVKELLQEGTLLGLKLLFQPSMLGLVFVGRVRYSRLCALGDGYVIGVEFLHRDAPSRALLARHILRVQAIERRDRLLRDGYAEEEGA